MQIVAGNGCNGLVRQAEPFVLEGVDHALCPILLRNSGVQRASEVRPEVCGYRHATDEIVVQVYPTVLIPQLLLDGAICLPGQFLVGRRVFTYNTRYLREVFVRLVQE